MAIEKVKEYFAQFGIAERVQEFDVSSATVELAAQALNCEPSPRRSWRSAFRTT